MIGNRRTTLYLGRHGDVHGASEFRLSGHTDVELTPKGLAQSKALVKRLSRYTLGGVYGSDLQRSSVATRMLGEAIDKEPEYFPELREIYFGEYEGLRFNEAYERGRKELGVDKMNYRYFFERGFPGGEGLSHLRERVIPKLNELIERHKGGTLAVIAHGGVNRVIICEALGLSLEPFYRIEQDHCCLNIIEYRGKRGLLKLMNSTNYDEME